VTEFVVVMAASYKLDVDAGDVMNDHHSGGRGAISTNVPVDWMERCFPYVDNLLHARLIYICLGDNPAIELYTSRDDAKLHTAVEKC